ncbi:hypothetical protein ZOSMA_468G00010 [Zostera marina]|uniref:Uncharacterized protein n=1 Tax=Zostera marina TaxID=29655 RepID=A0A0K9P020_ZOSMR|nr:hypothetical protein ZOSMA_468G00010 [Zostera marina]
MPEDKCNIPVTLVVNLQNHSKEQKQQLQGTFYASSNPEARSSNPPLLQSQSPLFNFVDSIDGNWFFQQQSRKRSSVEVAMERGSNFERDFPRICIWESDGEAGDITCDIIDTVEASMLYKDGIDKIVAVVEAEEYHQQNQQQQQQQRKSPRCFIGGEPKRQGHTISKGHKNYDLMCNLQLGISYFVEKSTQMREQLPLDALIQL